MITEKTRNCAFFNGTNMCKLLHNTPFDCERCVAFHVMEIVPRKKVEEDYEDDKIND